jgi:hypothetical protein
MNNSEEATFWQQCDEALVHVYVEFKMTGIAQENFA